MRDIFLQGNRITGMENKKRVMVDISMLNNQIKLPNLSPRTSACSLRASALLYFTRPSFVHLVCPRVEILVSTNFPILFDIFGSFR
jgi:hypothetical protein